MFKIDDDVVAKEGFGKVIGIYGTMVMVHVRYGKRYTGYRMYEPNEIKKV